MSVSIGELRRNKAGGDQVKGVNVLKDFCKGNSQQLPHQTISVWDREFIHLQNGVYVYTNEIIPFPTTYQQF